MGVTFNISRILEFPGSAGKKIREFGFQAWKCTVFESNKNGSHLVVFVTLFATNFLEVQQCKKED